MRDLICISAYCPDEYRLKMLSECVDSLIKGSHRYDIMVNSHTHVPKEIAEKVDYVFYEKTNDLIEDPRYLLSLFYSPYPSLKIHSTYVKRYNTALACAAIFVSMANIARNFGYKKIHYIEYDSLVKNFKEIDENSKLLDTYNSVCYKLKVGGLIEGRFRSLRLDTLSEIYEVWDRDKWLKLLKQEKDKGFIVTLESVHENLLKEKGNMFVKNSFGEGLLTNLSVSAVRHKTKHWSVPYYDPKKDKIYVLTAEDYFPESTIKYVVNEGGEITHKMGKNMWKLSEVGDIENIDTIDIFLNGEKRDTIDFNKIGRDRFKETNFAVYDI